MPAPRLLLLALLALCAVPTSAHAATTIGFDALPNGTVVDSEFASDGVTFSTVGGAVLPRIAGPVAKPRSAPNVLNASTCEFGSSSEICGGMIRGDFTELRRTFTVWAGAWSTVSGATVELRAFNSAGAQVGATQTAPVFGEDGFIQPLTVTSDAQDILYFTFGAIHGRFGIDDLTFDSTPSATPTFSLERTAPFLDAGITKGTSKVVNFGITRTASSTGNIDLSVSGLPAGVTGTFSPNPYTTSGPGSGTGTLTLTASPSAPAGDGPSTVTVTATPSSPSAGTGSRSFTFDVIVRQTYDARITSIEVNQAVQELALPTPDPTTRTASYQGVPLAARKKTIVRVYANLAAGPAAGVPGTIVALHAARGGVPLPGSPLLPDWGERRLFGGGATPSFERERIRPGGAFSFTLPASWASGSLVLRAELSGPNGVIGSAVDECAACRANNVMTLRDVTFTATTTPELTLLSLEYVKDGARVVPRAPWNVFGRFNQMAPFGEGALWLPPYEASIDITDLATMTTVSYWDWDCRCLKTREATDDDRNSGALARVQAYELRRRERDSGLGGFLTVGVNTGVARGVHQRITPADTYLFGLLTVNRGHKSTAVVEQERPVTSVGHETWHAFGAPHASTCTDGSDPERTEDWAPDQRGYLQGVGIDSWPGSGGTAGPYRMLGAGVPDAATQWYDLMSYCAGEANAWVSPRNWRRAFTRFQARAATGKVGRSARAIGSTIVRATSTRPMLQVSAYTDAIGGQLVLTSVDRFDGVLHPADASAEYQLLGMDAAGAVVASAPMAVGESAAAGGTTYSIRGAVPAASVASVEIQRAGTVVSTRTRSASAPTVRIVAPAAGAVVGGRIVTLRYVAGDRDGDRLTATVEYSRDNGRSWVPVYVGPARATTTLAAGTLARSTSARLRVRINDGFRSTAATSARFTSLGAPPTAVIVTPRRSARLAQDATLVAAGQGWGEAGARLPASRLRWFVGRRLVGTGTHLAASRLPAGRSTLRLVVTDAVGRSSSARIPLVVTAVRPRFTVLGVPARVSRTATSVRLRVASHVPARVFINRVAYPTGRLARTITVPIRPGASSISLGMRLTAGGASSIVTRTIRRS